MDTKLDADVPKIDVDASKDSPDNAPIVITEVTTTRTITINENADLSDPNMADLIKQLKIHGVTPTNNSNVSNTMGAAGQPTFGNRENYTYVSEEETDPYSPHQRQNRSQFGATTNGEHSSTRHPRHGGWSTDPSAVHPAPSKPQSNLPAPMNLPLLALLGSFSELDKTSDVAKMIKIYAKNSINLSPKSNMKLKVHSIMKKDGILSNLLPGSVTKPESKKKSKGQKWSRPGTGTDDLSMLLWFKTTPDSVRRLAMEKDSCIAFYDRLCRSMPVPVDKMKENCRQTVLLCKVKLGNMHKSEQGYTRWHRRSHAPSGYDSVKAAGKWKPDWSKNCQHKKTIVPCGQSEKSPKFSSCELDYNEYLVFQAKLIKVKFAVDIELVAKSKGRKD